MSDNNDNTMPWTVFAAGAPGDTSKVGATLKTFQAIGDAALTRERYKHALDCDAGIVRNWLVQNLPSGTMDRLRASLLESLPDGAILVTLPHSEVCVDMKVTGTRMFAVPVESGMAQLYTLDGEKFSFPITLGEAGVNMRPDEGQGTDH